jgi:hypothetical protein
MLTPGAVRKMPVAPVTTPLLVMPPENVETRVTEMPFPAAEIVPALVIPPAKL